MKHSLEAFFIRKPPVRAVFISLDKRNRLAYAYIYMGFEQLGAFDLKVESSDKREKQEILERKIAEIAIAFADQSSQGDAEAFLKCLKEGTPIASLLSNTNGNAEAEIEAFFEQAGKCYLEGKVNGIVHLYDDARKKLKSEEQGEDYVSKNYFMSNIIEMEDSKNSSRYEALMREGFSRHDEFLEIHVEEMFKSGHELSKEAIKEGMSQIAEKIVLDMPEAAAVVGCSWLLDTPLAEKLGFITLPSSEREGSLANWLQLVDKEGNINKKRFDQLVSTGKLPYQARIGYMRTVNFLTRYLPDERRGRVMLKRLKEVAGDDFPEYALIEAAGRSFKEAWPQFRLPEELDAFLAAHPIILEIMEESGGRDEYIRFLRSNIGCSVEELNNRKDERIRELDKLQADIFHEKKRETKYEQIVLSLTKLHKSDTI